MPSVFHNTQPLAAVSEEWLDILKREAAQSPTGRARLCLHRSSDDAIQEMLIVFHRNSLIRPHRHHPGRCESFHMADGELAVVIFDDRGVAEQCIEMGPPGSGKVIAYRMSEPRWHLVAPLTEFAAVYEIGMGPFSPDNSEEASWSPTGGNELARYTDDALQKFGLRRSERR